MLFGQTSESNGTVRIQAESFSANFPKVLSDSATGVTNTYAWTTSAAIGGYSGTGLMQVLPNDALTVTNSWTSTSPELRYTINFANPGTYYVWIRGYAESAESFSVYVGLNGVSPADAQIDLPKTGTWSWSNQASGSTVPVAVTVPTAGQHTLNLWMRDAGFAVDRIVLTLNSAYLPEYSADFWRNQSIYQIITDRFFDGDTNNNVANLPNYSPSTGDRAHGGDFKGIEKKLDYIKALGATAIWISPVVKNANGDYHGYAATDFYAVNPRMGTMADLQRLIAEAHKRGILVINDVVANHASTWVDSADAGWGNTFRYPPAGYALRYNSGGNTYASPFDTASLTAAFGNTSLTNIFHNNCGNILNYGDASQVELGELVSLDDFRTESPYVRTKMKEIWSYWINTAGFDAYRIDTVKHVEMGFWDDWTPAIRAAATAADKPNFFMFGEVFDGSDSKCGSYTGTKSGGNFKMDSVLDYPLYYLVGSVFATATGNTGQIEGRYNNLNTANYDASALNSLVLNLDNHDNPRFLSTGIGGNTTRLEVALVFLYTSRGIPSLYYGTEQDFDGGADPWNREDMFDGQFEGGPSNGDNFNMTSARFKLVAKLNNLRRLYPSLRTGTHNNLWAIGNGPGPLAYSRRLGSEEVYVALNTASTSQTIGARPTIHPAGTVLVNVLNPSETYTVTTGVDGIPSIVMPPNSYKMFVAQSQLKALNPVILAVTPAHDGASISTGSAITVTFDRAMNPTTTQTAFSTAPATTGTFAWGSSNTVMTYTPSSSLAGTTLYTVKVGSTASDTNGMAMFAPFESRFTTAVAASMAKPSVNSVTISAVTTSSATLGATITPNGAATSVWFEYGTTTSYGTATPSQNVGSGNSPVSASAALSGLLPGATYHFRPVAQNSQGTTYGPDTTFTTDVVLPQVTTTTASFVTTGSANLNGDVNPNGIATTYYFEYGVKSDTLNLTTPVQDAGSAAGLVERWASVSGLSPETTYYFRVVAQSGANIVRGSVLSFTTLPVKPTVTTLGVTNAMTTAATLQGAVNPNGSATSFYFEYGITSSYGSSTAAQDAGNGTNSVSLSAVLTGLTLGQTYYYRAVASNSFGVSYGTDQTFLTGKPPPTVTTGIVISGTNSATLSGAVNPNGSETIYWFEYGTTAAYGQSTRSEASDDLESYNSSTLSYSSTSAGATVTANGGTGFGRFASYVSTSSSRGGIRLITTNSINGTNRQIDGLQSFGVFAGTSTTRGTHSGYRSVTIPQQYGQVKFSARFDISNEKGFTGINLKSTNGTSFGANELMSVGMAPAGGGVGGNTALLVTDAAGQKNLDLGAEVRGAIIDVIIDFDANSGIYTCGAKFRADTTYKTVSGNLKLSGLNTRLTTLGYINGNNTGNGSQYLIFDGLQVVSAASAGSGSSPVAASANLSNLIPNTTYYYRMVAQNSTGQSIGEAASFLFTGLNMGPTISDISNQTINFNTATGPISFTISYNQALAVSPTLSGTSSNTSLVPNANIVFGGSGVNRTVTVTPVAGQSGTATITVTVNDGTLTASDPFVLTVNPAPDITLEQSRGWDSATNSVYSNSFIDLNGGYGYSNWVGSRVGTVAGTYLDTASNGLKSFAIYSGGGTGNSYTASRSFSAAMAGGEVLRLQLGYTTVSETNGEIGMRLFAGTNTNALFKLSLASSNSLWQLNDGDQNFGASGITNAPGTPLNFSFKRNAGAGYDIRLASGTNVLSGINWGTNRPVMAVDRIEFYSTAQGANQNFRFANLERVMPCVSTGAPTLDFGTTPMGTPVTQNYILRNDGTGTLSGLALTKSGTNTNDFTVGSLATNSLPAGVSTSFQVAFNPKGQSSRAASLSVASNDPDENPFLMNFSGIGLNTAPSIVANFNPQLLDVNTGTDPLPFQIQDQETPAEFLIVMASSSNTALVPNSESNIVIGGSGGDLTIAVAPVANQVGNTDITVLVSDGDQSVSQTLAVTVVSPSASWRTQYFGSADNSGIGADTNAPAGDGIPNLVKYALGISNVLTPATTGLPEMKMTNNKLALTFNRQKSATDIVYKVQATGDLFGFSNGATVLWSSDDHSYTNAGTFEAVTVEDTVDSGQTNRRFMRLKISRP